VTSSPHFDAAEPDSEKESGSDFDKWLVDQLPYDSLVGSDRYKADILLGREPAPGCG